jgi:hypothetical protein
MNVIPKNIMRVEHQVMKEHERLFLYLQIFLFGVFVTRVKIKRCHTRDECEARSLRSHWISMTLMTSLCVSCWR